MAFNKRARQKFAVNAFVFNRFLAHYGIDSISLIS